MATRWPLLPRRRRAPAHPSVERVSSSHAAISSFMRSIRSFTSLRASLPSNSYGGGLSEAISVSTAAASLSGSPNSLSVLVPARTARCRRRPHWRRALSGVALKGSLPQPLPFPACVSCALLEAGQTWRAPDGRSSCSCLRRMLLGHDGCHVRRRHHEPRLDGIADSLHVRRKGNAIWQGDGILDSLHPRRHGRMDSSFSRYSTVVEGPADLRLQHLPKHILNAGNIHELSLASGEPPGIRRPGVLLPRRVGQATICPIRTRRYVNGGVKTGHGAEQKSATLDAGMRPAGGRSPSGGLIPA